MGIEAKATIQPKMDSSPGFSPAATPCPNGPTAATKHKAGLSKRRKDLGKRVEDQESDIKDELSNLRTTLEELERRRHMDAVRAAVRHEIVFGALKKILEEIHKLKEDGELPDGGTPGSSKKKNQEGRKNLERCLEQYTRAMEGGVKLEQVREAGKLCVSYSDSLFRMYM